MLSENMELQAAEHPLEFSGQFKNLRELCLHLMHKRAYEDAALLVGGKLVLDLGCNNGWGTSILASSARAVVGLDISTKAIDDAKRRFPHIDFRTFDGVSIPLGDGTVDVIVSCQVIEHVVDTGTYLKEICRVLTPDGTAVFTTPNSAIRLDAGMKPWNRFHVREYRADELTALLIPFFGTVTVNGLFAKEPLYSTELERVTKAKLAARKPKLTSPPAKPKDGWVLSGLKSVLPRFALDYMRRMRDRARSAALKRFGTEDLFYRSQNLDVSLDLRAVCTGPRTHYPHPRPSKDASD